MNNNKDIFSNDNKLFLIKSIYLIMLVSYFIFFVFLCFTNGSIRYFLQQNMLYILLPMALPLLLSLVGLNDFKIEKNAEHLKIYSSCIFMSEFSENYREKIIVNIKEPFENNISTSHFGLRKSLVVRQMIKNKSVKSKVNISLLSRAEQEDLKQKLNFSK
ncbi:MAG: hypothetical protein ISP71_07440 [Flavobacteriales bacterium]|nr:hypothetical protein [Flavobacteriales bacterium]